MIQDVQSLTKTHFNLYMFTHVDLGGMFDLISRFITYCLINCLTIEGRRWGIRGSKPFYLNQLRQIEILKPNSRVD